MSAPRAYPAHLDVAPIERARGVVRVPGSKSISIRALLLAALAEGETELVGLLDSDDTRVMREALVALGVPLVPLAQDGLRVFGSARFPRDQADLFVGNSGLSARTLIAALAFMGGHYRLAGVARMHERPIDDLVTSLVHLGARIAYLESPGRLPLEILPAERTSGLPVRVRGAASSQFLTGLLQAATLLAETGDCCIELEGTLISRPYVALTLDVMRRFGVSVAGDVDAPAATFRIAQGSRYRSPGRFAIEGDASSASYFLGLGAAAGGPVRVQGLGRESVQGDIGFAEVLSGIGATVRFGPDWIEASSAGVRGGFRFAPFDLDLNHIPDAAMTLAVLALFAKGPSRLRNIGSWRVKETDRLAAMACELEKLGAQVRAGDDFLEIEPPRTFCAATIKTYDDHRMAMAFTLAACGGHRVRIEDPGCVAKTFPDYFERLDELLSRTEPGS